MQIADPKHSLKAQVGVIALTAAMLLSIVVLKNGFSFSFARGEKVPEVKYTYDSVKNEVALRSGSESVNSQQLAKTDEQLAALDPNYKNGNVLGASTETAMEVPPAEEIFTPETLGQIKVRLLATTNSENVKKYSEDVLFVESSNNSDALLMALNSDDKNVLKDVPAQADTIVGQLAGLDVPKELELYHKLKMIYFTNLGNIAKDFMGEGSKEFGINENTTILFSLLEMLDKIQADIQTKYGVGL